MMPPISSVVPMPGLVAFYHQLQKALLSLPLGSIQGAAWRETWRSHPVVISYYIDYGLFLAVFLFSYDAIWGQ